MTKKQALLKAIRVMGGKKELAASMGVGYTAVDFWLRQGFIPPANAPKIRDITDGRVTIENVFGI